MPDTDTMDSPDVEQPQQDAAPVDAPDDLGDAGKKALAEERAARKAAEKAARAAQKQADEVAARLAEIDEANKSEQQKAIEQAAKEAADKARTETLAEANRRLLNAEMRAAAAGQLQDPADAIRYIDNLDELIDGDGNPDSAAIVEAVKALASERPYLAVGATPPNHGSADGGARSGPRQLSRDALKGMTPQQIVEAKAKGQLDGLLRGGK